MTDLQQNHKQSSESFCEPQNQRNLLNCKKHVIKLNKQTNGKSTEKRHPKGEKGNSRAIVAIVDCDVNPVSPSGWMCP